MSTLGKTFTVLALAVGATLIGYLSGQATPSDAAPAGAPRAFPESAWAQGGTDLAGHPHSFQEYRGKILLINFWATWCPPCQKEGPALQRLEEKLQSHGVQVVGITIDQAANLQAYVDKHPGHYPLWLATPQTARLMASLGNPQGGLPFSVVLDRSGQIRKTLLGAINETETEHLLASLAQGQ